MKFREGPGPVRGRRISIREARNPLQVDHARTLFLEYRTWLATHREVTDFPDSVLATGLTQFDAEVTALPGEYARPLGALFVAYDGGHPIGCAALRPVNPETAEFKRLFVQSNQRKSGVGRRLTLRAIRRAGELGYRRVILDTLPKMSPAISLYRSLGFQRIPPYWAHPVPGALFFEFRVPPPSRSLPKGLAHPRRRGSRSGARLPAPAPGVAEAIEPPPER
jgi:carbonic anhydrase